MILSQVLLVFMGLLAFLAAETGCDRASGNEAKIVVVFADISGSVKDFTVYRDAWPKIIGRLRGGDRVVLAPITDKTYTGFRPLIDQDLPGFSYFNDNKLVYEKAVQDLDRQFSEALDDLLSMQHSPKTDIMNAFILAHKIFDGDNRRRVLVILSDMLEDSEEYNFEQMRLTEASAQRIIEKKRREHTLPHLGGAIVYMAGASATTASKAQEVERFWRDYVRAANGRLLPQNYGPALVSFAE